MGRTLTERDKLLIRRRQLKASIALRRAPETKACAFSIALTPEDITALRTGTAKAFMYCKLTYRDIYRPDMLRHSQFCFSVEWKGESRDTRNGKTVDLWAFAPVTRFVSVN